MIFGQPKTTTPPKDPLKAHNPTCVVFHWIGQSFSSCDNCGKPLHEHLYWPPFGGKKPIFWVKQWVEYRQQWVSEPVGSLVSRADANASVERVLAGM